MVAATAAAIPVASSAQSALASGPDANLTVRARGATGQERLEVRVAGTTLAAFTVTTDWHDYVVQTPSGAGVPGVEVAFVNDSLVPADRNLYVDAVRYAGVTYEAEAETTRSTGAWSDGQCRSGVLHSEELACKGSLLFGDLAGPPVPDADPASPGSAVEIWAAGATGNELAEVRIDGVAVAVFRPEASPDLVNAPAFTRFAYQHPDRVTSTQVTVAFINDRYLPGVVDYNLRVEGIAIDGVGSEPIGTTPSSPATAVPVCRPARLADRLLACDGSVAFAATPEAGSDPTLSETGGTVITMVAETTTTTSGPTTTKSTSTTTSMSTTKSTSTTAPTTSTSTAGPTVTTRPSTTRPSTTQPATTQPATTQPVTTRPPAGGSPATGQFYVVGKDIVGPDGRIFYPIGANAAIKFTPYGYVFEGNNGGVAEHLDSVMAWNWNTIRATLVCDNSSGVPTFTELVDGIAPAIDQLTAAGIVVILECHDSTGQNPKLGSAKDLRIRRFWDEMARRYGDNPYVWFNIYNEPDATGDLARWSNLHQYYVDRIRATGAENLVVVDLPGYAQGIDQIVNGTAGDRISRSCNTVFGWHTYGAIAGRQGTLGDHEAMIVRAQQKGMALIAGELGVASPANWGNAGPWEWNLSGFDAMASLGPRYGIGLLWWHATGDEAFFSLYALKADRSGFWTAGNGGNLTTYGQKFWDVSHRVSHDRGPFTGNLAASGCPSVSG